MRTPALDTALVDSLNAQSSAIPPPATLISLSRRVGAVAGAEALSVLAFSVSITDREQIFHLSWFCLSCALSPHSPLSPPFLLCPVSTCFLSLFLSFPIFMFPRVQLRSYRRNPRAICQPFEEQLYSSMSA